MSACLRSTASSDRLARFVTASGYLIPRCRRHVQLTAVQHEQESATVRDHPTSLNPCKTPAAGLLKDRKFLPARLSSTLKPHAALALGGSRYGILPLRRPRMNVLA